VCLNNSIFALKKGQKRGKGEIQETSLWSGILPHPPGFERENELKEKYHSAFRFDPWLIGSSSIPKELSKAVNLLFLW
jgi:hypothetical protein